MSDILDKECNYLAAPLKKKLIKEELKKLNFTKIKKFLL